ncbi:MAG TPA: glutathione S-transferase family protein [Polyangiaceae bacterium]|jgi:glutathione S-transferase|nr:glutathione S-transferase family protein [Polyangiaceae bacterium]
MSYELYTIAGAPRPWRAMLGLIAKGIPFTPRLLEASRKQHKAPAFLALNQRGRVPVLVQGDFVLSESIAILAYLDRVQPEPPLFGRTPEQCARVWEQVMAADHFLREATQGVVGPLLGLREPLTEEALAQAGAKLRDELVRLETRLGRAPFLCGDALSAGDCVAFPDVRLTQRTTVRFPEVTARLGLHPISDVFPAIARWIARIEALPGYEQTFPEHWK